MLCIIFSSTPKESDDRRKMFSPYLLIVLIVPFAKTLETPVVGILSQEAYLVSHAYPDAHSFIVASYIKLVESSGARVIPIW